jgi:hypothetical protein
MSNPSGTLYPGATLYPSAGEQQTSTGKVTEYKSRTAVREDNELIEMIPALLGVIS